MQFGNRWQRVTSTAVIWEWKNKVYHDKDEKFTLEDLDETAYAAAHLGLIWSPQIALLLPWSFTPLAIVEGAVFAGAAASFAIGGLEGVETYADFFAPDMFTEPDKLTALEKATNVALSVTNPLHIPQKKFAEWLVEDAPWGEVFKNRWSNPTPFF